MSTIPGKEIDDADPTLPMDAPTVRAALEKYASNASAFLAYNRGNLAFTSNSIEGIVPFRATQGRYLIMLCGPISPSTDKTALIADFIDYADRRGKSIIAAQVSEADSEILRVCGFVMNQLGSTFSIDLSDYSLAGKRMKRVRNKVSQSRREQVTVEKIDPTQTPEIVKLLDQVDREWLRDKGSHVKEIEVLVGERREITDDRRVTYVARKDGRVIAYSTFVPSYGNRPGYLWDLTRRAAGAPPGVVEHIYAVAVDDLQAKGAPWLHLGLTPFVGLDDRHELPGRSSVTRAVIRGFGRYGERIYPSSANEFFKNKLRPTHIEPEYIGFHNGVRLGAVVALLRTTQVI